jgi:GT2 family glycosyltransferase
MKETETIEIAVLIACYNRKQKTIDFLDSLTKHDSFRKFTVDIFLLDDGSTDGTGEAVREKYPNVNILTGTGNLFWAGGMRTIWKYAIAHKSYDLFCLFNDDVALFDNAFENLVKHYQKSGKNGTILIGSTLDPKTGEMSYGGYVLQNKKHSKYIPVKPGDNKSIPCDLANGNILLVDSITVKKIGVFLDAYTHYMADFDYTLTASRSGINVLIAPGYYGYCENDHGNPWLPGSKPLKERIKYLYSPKGLAYKEYLIYIKDKFPQDYFVSIIKLWMKTLLPVIWDKFKRKDY